MSRILIARLALAAWLPLLLNAASAQYFSPPEFLGKHFHYEAVDSRDGPKLRTQLDFIDHDAVITRGTVKFNNAGFEQHVAVGTAQNLGATRAALTYNLRRFNYRAETTQRDDVTLDLHYGRLRAQHRFEEGAQVSTLGIPLDIKFAHFDLSFSQTTPVNSDDTVDLYKIASRIKRLKFVMSFKNTATSQVTDYLTEYRLSGRWLLKYAYADYGQRLSREFRSEYSRRDYRLAGEIKSQSYLDEESRVTSAVAFETQVKAATLKLRFEYSDYIDSPTVSFNVETLPFL